VTLLLIILVSVIAILALLSWALVLFTRHFLHNDLRKIAQTLLVLLILQFILGMMSNLFQSVPSTQPWRVFHDFGPILFHTANATLLLILGFVFLYHALRGHMHPVAARIGLASIILAYICGVMFVNFGQINLYSFGMALGFISAFTVYSYLAFAREK
jgi:hypothetical protein